MVRPSVRPSVGPSLNISETALRIFLIFCMKLGHYKGKKVTEPFFWKKWPRTRTGPKGPKNRCKSGPILLNGARFTPMGHEKFNHVKTGIYWLYWWSIHVHLFKGKVGLKISPFSIQIPKFTTSDPFVLFPLLVAKVQHWYRGNWFQYLWFSWFSGRRQHWYRGKRSYPLPVPGPSFIQRNIIRVSTPRE